MEIEIGASKEIYRAGDFLLVPPDKYHDYWFVGDQNVCLFVVVAPNHKYYRWKTSDFPPEAHQGAARWSTYTRPMTFHQTNISSAKRSRLRPAKVTR